MSTRSRSFRVLGLFAILAIVGIFALPVLLRLTLHDPNVRHTDLDTAPADPANPATRPDRLAPDAAMTPEAVLQLLQRRGYREISDPEPRANGAWTAHALKEAGGKRLTLTVDRHGGVTEE